MLNVTLNTFFSSWIRSLRVLLPSNIRTLGMLSINGWRYVITSLIGGAWGLMLVQAMISVIAGTSLLSRLGEYGINDERIPEVNNYLLIFLIACAARSSVGLKTVRYFTEKLYTFFPVYVVMSLLLSVVARHVAAWLPKAWALREVVHSIFDLYGLIFLFFLLDSMFSWDMVTRAPVNAFKMLVYNLPLMLIVLGISLNMHWLTIAIVNGVETMGLGHPLALHVLHYGLTAIMLTLYIALISTIYIKRLYDQSSLYTV